MKPLKLLLCQFDIIWENAQANKDYLSQLFQMIPAETADLIILPEMFTTGFTMNSEKFAETMDGPSVQWMKATATKLHSAITGSLIIEENGHYFNRMLWIEPGIEHIQYYDKKHLFSLAGEEKHYKAGQNKLQVQWKGWNIALFICYDLRFPVWTRNTDNADL
jgi:omega-amidase